MDALAANEIFRQRGLPVGAMIMLPDGGPTHQMSGQTWLRTGVAVVNDGTYLEAEKLDYLKVHGKELARPFTGEAVGLVVAFGKFFTASGTNVYSSTDGLSWTTIASGIGTTITSIAASSNTLIVKGNAGTTNIRISTNGTSFFDGAVVQAVDVVLYYLHNLFVSINASTLYTSADGVAWTNRSFNPTAMPVSAASTGSLSVFGVGTGTSYAYSTNGTTWTLGTVPAGSFSLANGIAQATFAALGSEVFYRYNTVLYGSTNGTTWTQKANPLSYPAINVSASQVSQLQNNAVTIGAGGSAVLGYSANGATWSRRSWSKVTGSLSPPSAFVAINGSNIVRIGNGTTEVFLTSQVWPTADYIGMSVEMYDYTAAPSPSTPIGYVRVK
jgi:hypothetical protein